MNSSEIDVQTNESTISDDSFIENNLISPNSEDFKNRERFFIDETKEKNFLKLCDRIRYIIYQQQPIGNYQPNFKKKSSNYIKESKKRPLFLCTIPDCPFQFFSKSLLRDHNKKCSHNNEFLNVFDLKEKGYIKDYFDYQNYNFELKKLEIKGIFTKLSNNLNKIIKNLYNDSIRQLISQAKEFRLKSLINEINKKYNDCEGNTIS